MTEKDILTEMLKRGDTEAAYKLGKLCSAANDYDDAVKYYLIGADNDHLLSMNALGTLYYTKGRNDREKMNGLNYWYLAASKGCVQAMANLALAYFDDDKLDEAEEYWKKAAELELPEAYLGIGKVALRRGDYKAAETAFQKAADMGCTAAWNDLGILMQMIGNNVRAGICFTNAAMKGDKTAAANLERLKRKGEPI